SPLPPSRPPTTEKRAEDSPYFDRGGEGVTSAHSPNPLARRAVPQSLIPETLLDPARHLGRGYSQHHVAPRVEHHAILPRRVLAERNIPFALPPVGRVGFELILRRELPQVVDDVALP